MNLPFTLSGPHFLLFYVVLLFLLRQLVRIIQVLITNKTIPIRSLCDSSLIAYLAGGPTRVTQVTAISLLERKLLNVEGISLTNPEPTLFVERSDASTFVRKPIESALLAHYKSSNQTKQSSKKRCTLPAKPETLCGMEGVRNRLIDMGALPNNSQQFAMSIVLWVAIFFAWSIGTTKVVIALQHHHSNILFLLILIVVTPFSLKNNSLTGAGINGLKSVRKHFSHLENRTNFSLDGTTNELAFTVALFGLSALPMELFLWKKALEPVSMSSSSGTDSSSSSSCGSGSSSCGGGGCGGGCGGCG